MKDVIIDKKDLMNIHDALIWFIFNKPKNKADVESFKTTEDKIRILSEELFRGPLFRQIKIEGSK